jgi:hypothetical protein
VRDEVRESFSGAEQTRHAGSADAPARRLSVRQIEAVYAVMRLLRDDGNAETAAEILCASCRRFRPGRGSVSYDGNLLCNGCATDFELLSAARRVRGVEEFLRSGGRA